jgi:molybdopterin synthase sulfur carrier subunit
MIASKPSRARMKIHVKFFTSLREITDKKVDEIQLQSAITVEELLSILSEKYGKKFREYIYNKKGKVQDFLSFLVNGKNINILQGFDTELKQGDTIAILPPVGGG